MLFDNVFQPMEFEEVDLLAPKSHSGIARAQVQPDRVPQIGKFSCNVLFGVSHNQNHTLDWAHRELTSTSSERHGVTHAGQEILRS